MIDRKKLRESLTPDDIIHLMNMLGATEYADKGKYIQFKTICHNIYEDSAGLNLSYYKDNFRFYCFSECGSMDIFEVIKHRWELLQNGEDTHFDNLAYWVMNHSQIDLDEHNPVSTFKNPITPNKYSPTTEIILPEKNKNILDSFINYHCVEWLDDGITDDAMDKYDIKYSISRNAVIIPHYDVHDRLIGIRRRALNPEEARDYGKYKPLYIENISYSHPLGYNVYGLNMIINQVKKQKKILIAEGEKGALQGYSIMGEDNIVASVCGNKINRWQIHLIMKYCKPEEIIIAFDKGLDYDKIAEMCSRYTGYCNFSYLFDYNDHLLNDKESPFDRPDSLDKLIKGRIKIT